AGQQEEGHVGRAGGRGPGGRLGELSAPGASLVAEAHQWTHLRGKLALGAVRGPRHGFGALDSGRLRSVRLVTCHSLQRLDQLPLLELWFLETSVQWCQEWSRWRGFCQGRILNTHVCVREREDPTLPRRFRLCKRGLGRGDEDE
ncbi:hypothetical protein LEMLEM_LOCUS6589, partial [Lemmus lemmus]